ncbi:MAG: hypothetical protein AAF656_00405 [Planctomycetota bacterium]
MTIQLTTSLVSSAYVHEAGDIADVPDDEAFRLINAGFAKPMPDDAKLKTTDKPQPRTRKATAGKAA